ncbi:hypothetical protein NKJ50_31915 [Mesorhizobium sp. M0115]
MLRFVEHRVGDPRLISLIRPWLKTGVMEDGAVHPSEEGTQGGSISVLLSNVYLHYVLDLWFERVVKVRLKGEARLVRYIDDFVTGFQHQLDALQAQEALRHTLGQVWHHPGTDQDHAGRVRSVCAARCGQTLQKAPRDHLFPGYDALLLAEPEGELQGWDAHGEVSTST